MSQKLTRTIHPQIKVLSEAQGLVEYVASDETLDSYKEIIRAAGWKFDERFTTNPTFVDSHRYNTIQDVLGRIVDWRVSGDKLIEVAQWAIDVEENHLARLGFRMTAKGYLKAVSVGFMPVRSIGRNDEDFGKVADAMKLSPEARDKVRTIFYEQQQWELSACVLGANPSALARAVEAKDVDQDLLKGVGLGGDEGAEVIAFAAEISETHPDPAVRRMAAIQLRQYAALNLSAGRGHRGTASPQPGRGASGGGNGQTSRETRSWLKQVADHLPD